MFRFAQHDSSAFPARISFLALFRLRCFQVRCLRNQKLLPDLQFARVFNMIQRNQIVVRDFQLLCDRDRIIALFHDVGFAGRRKRRLRMFIPRRRMCRFHFSARRILFL